MLRDHPSPATPNQRPAVVGPTVTAAEAPRLTVKLLLSLIAWYRNIGEHGTARDLLEHLTTRSDSRQLAQERALLALTTGQPTLALATLSELAERTDSMSAWIALGRCHLEVGDLSGAAAIAAEHVERHPESVTVRQFAGDVARASSDATAARGHYEAVLALAPENATARAALGRLAVLTGNRAEAEATLARLLTSEASPTFNQLLAQATLADLLDQTARATALRHQALLRQAEHAARLTAEVDAALGRPSQHLETEELAAFADSDPVITRSAAQPPLLAPSEATFVDLPAARTPPPPAQVAQAEGEVDPGVLELLRRDFGYETLRPGQAAVIANVLAGRDTLAIMPTGAGKSLTFQIPAMLLDGVTLVLSPLIALMKDQVESLPPGVRDRTGFLNSSQSPDEQRRVLAGIVDGDYKLIYAAPERLRQHAFLSALRARGTPLVVVDEAHCISLWGHDFRPDYLTIPSALRELGDPPLLAITATATRRMADGIKEGFRRELDEIRTSVFRPNLFYEAHLLGNREQKVQRAIDIARRERGSGIIYVRSRRDAEVIAALLRDRGVATVPYHAGLAGDIRTQNQDRFMSGRARVVVATTAFGMGVNKSDVRFIIHLSPPASLEAYAQESGRAGRDGEPARCVLLATKSDRATLSRMARRDEQDITSLRRIYAGLKQAAVGSWAFVDPDALLRWQPAARHDETFDTEEEPDPRIALGLLEQAKLIKRHPDMPASYTLHLGRLDVAGESNPDALRERIAEWLGLDDGVGSPVTFRTGEALQALDCGPDALSRMLASRQELIVREGPRQACFELLPAGPDAAARIELVLARVRQDADRRIQQVMSYVDARRCRHALLANHLGEGLPDCGECCDVCVGVGEAETTGDEVTAGARAFTTAEDAVVVLEAVQSLSFALGKPGLTKFLLGSVESRVRADRSPYFGRLAGIKKSTLERLIGKLADEGFLEFYIDREYKLLRITDRGRHARQADLAAFESRRAPMRSDNGVTISVDAAPDGEALFERLRSWRRDRAIQDAVPPYVVAHDAQLRSLADVRPLDAAALLEVPGFGPTRVERYGSEIVAVIADFADGEEPDA